MKIRPQRLMLAAADVPFGNINTMTLHTPKRLLSRTLLSILVVLGMSTVLNSRGYAQLGSGSTSGSATESVEKETPESETVAVPVAPPSYEGLYKEIEGVPENIRKSAPFARELHEMVRRAGTSGTFDFEQRAAAFEASRQDLLRASATEEAAALKQGKGILTPLADAWTNIGLKGTSSQGVYSAGCTTALAVDPSNPNVMYAGATSGGVWKSTDAGGTWVALTDNVIPNLTVASIAIDPNHTQTLYVGTGNGFASVDNMDGTGIYKSTNAGATWTRIGSASLSGTIVKVLVHPTKSNIILASSYTTNRGIWRSTDSGATWTRVYTAAAVVWDIVPGINIGGTQVFYAVEGNNPGLSATSECGVFKSANDGSTWSKLVTSPLPNGSRIGRSALAVPTANPNRVFVFMSNASGDTLGLYRSTDNGGTWTSLSIPGTVFKPFSSLAPQGWYDVYLGVTPNSNANADTMYIGGIEGWVNYSDASGWQQYSGYADFPADPPHVDHHSIAFNPRNPSMVYVGTDGGVYRSTDAGQNWYYRSNLMVTNRFYRIGLDKNDNKSTYGGAQDQGTWKITNGASPSAQLKLGGDGFQAIVSPQTSQTIYGELPMGELHKTVNSGSSWTQLGASYFTDNADWDTPFKMAMANYGSTPAYNILYEGRSALWRSLDGGTSWNSISSNFAGGPISAIGISQVDSRNIFVGMSNGGIQLTTNAGTSWASKSSGIPSGARVTSIVTTGRDTNFALASFYTFGTTAHVCRTTDKGTTWTNMNGVAGATLPGVGVSCVALDSVNPTTVWYAATDNGIYYTLDGGQHWSVAGSGLGLAPCRDVQLHPNKTTLRVATFGRGIWEASTNTLPIELSSLTYQKTSQGTHLFWHTDSERNSDGFFVERSIDGAAFESLGFIKGQGNSNVRHDYSFLDQSTQPGTYLFQIKEGDLDGSEHYSNHVEVHYGNDHLIAYQSYPNPFLLGQAVSDLSGSIFGVPTDGVRPALSTRFHYELPDKDGVTLTIYNAMGAVTKTLVNHETQDAGEQDAFWDGRDNDGQMVSSGTYFYTIETEHFGKYIGKLLLIHD